MENYQLITKALGYINRNFRSGGITIEKIAGEAGFSTDYFNRIFRAHTGFNVMEYVRFCRLSDAAVKLRQSDASVLDIGLRVGYDSHDGFTRAFKAQYGKTPSEYRDAMQTCPMCFADLNLNATAGARMEHMLENFRVVPADTAVDYLLKTDAKRFGYDAVSILWNGTCVLSDGDLDTCGCYVGGDMYFDNPYLYLHVRGLAQMRRYVELLMRMKPGVIQMQIEEQTDAAAIAQCLAGIACTKISEVPQTMYFGGAKPIPEYPYSFRFLDVPDADAVDAWTKLANVGWRMAQTMATPMENRPADLPIGMFDGERLVGIARAGIQSAHGFTINNCIVPAILPEFASDANYRLFYDACMNLMMTRECVLYEDMLFGELSTKCGHFTAIDAGYELVNTAYILEF